MWAGDLSPRLPWTCGREEEGKSFGEFLAVILESTVYNKILRMVLRNEDRNLSLLKELFFNPKMFEIF